MYADLYYDKPKSWWIHFFEDEMKWKLLSEIKPPLQTALELWFYMPTIKIFSFFSFYCILEEIDKKLKISTIQLSVLYRVSLSKSYLVEFWCVWTSCRIPAQKKVQLVWKSVGRFFNQNQCCASQWVQIQSKIWRKSLNFFDASK